jgi:hypothetical protein
MRQAAIIFSALLLCSCSRASIPDLEDVPPPAAQASAEAQTPQNANAVAGSTGAIELTAEQRADVEKGVQKRLRDPNSAMFGKINARVSRNTTQSYIVCGWVNAKATGEYAGYAPFIAIYVPKMRVALLIGMGVDEPQTRAVRQRCSDEGVPLDA